MRPALAPVEIDFARAKLLERSPDLRLLVCSHIVYDFTGRPGCAVWKGAVAECSKGKRCPRCRFELSMLRLEAWRDTFLISKSLPELQRLARDMPRLQRALRAAATGWRDRRGVVHRYALQNPELTADVLRRELEEGSTCAHGARGDCERCAADDAATDAL